MTEWPIDWRAVVDEAIRRRKQEGLSQRALADLAGVSTPTVNAFEQGEIRLRFERITAILGALGMFKTPGAPDSFDAFRHNARRRWSELTETLAPDSPMRQPLGHSEHSYALIGLQQVPTARELRKLLAELPKTSGWPPFWVSTRPDLAPTIENDVVECWLGQEEADRFFADAAHSDFWQVSREARTYLRRGFAEDGLDNLDPGTVFDVTLPIWRTAEVLIHAANLARKLGGDGETSVHLFARYVGIEGRALLSWAQPLLRTDLNPRNRARSSQVDLDILTDVEKIDTELAAIVDLFLEPLYERFDGYRLSPEFVAGQITDLKRHLQSRTS